MTSPPPPHYVTISALPATCFPCRMTAQTCQPTQLRACLRRQHACSHETVFWKILHVFRPLCPLACVCVHRRVVTYSGHFLLRFSHGTFFCNFLNARRRLHSLTCVSLNPRVVTYSGHFLLRFLHGTFFCNFLNVRRRLHSLTCVSLNLRVVTYSGYFLLRFSHGAFFCNVLNALRLRPFTCVCSYVFQPPRGYIFRAFPSSLLQHIPSHTSLLSPAPTSAHAFSVTIMTFLFLISENNAVHQVSRLVIPGNAGYHG